MRIALTKRPFTFPRARPLIALLLLITAPGPAAAVEFDDTSAKAFLGLHGCNACHAPAEYRIGPPYEAVGVRWSNDPEGRVAILAAKIRHGGAGAWGMVPMISNPKITQDEAEGISRLILKQRPGQGSAPEAKK
jgi:cytochrome c